MIDLAERAIMSPNEDGLDFLEWSFGRIMRVVTDGEDPDAVTDIADQIACEAKRRVLACVTVSEADIRADERRRIHEKCAREFRDPRYYQQVCAILGVIDG